MEDTKTKSLETIALNNYVALKCTLPCSPPKNSICSGGFSASKIIYRVLMFSFSISLSFSYSTTEMLSCTALTALSQPHKLVTATHFLHQAKPQAHCRFPFKTLLPRSHVQKICSTKTLFWLSHLFFSVRHRINFTSRAFQNLVTLRFSTSVQGFPSPNTQQGVSTNPVSNPVPFETTKQHQGLGISCLYFKVKTNTYKK